MEIDESKFGKRKYYHKSEGPWVFGGREKV